MACRAWASRPVALSPCKSLIYLFGVAFRDNAEGDRTVLDEAKRLVCLYLGA